jgi:hypothetical protein
MRSSHEVGCQMGDRTFTGNEHGDDHDSFIGSDDNKIINQRKLLFQALKLKKVKRMASLAKAQQYLADLISQPIMDFEIHYEARLAHCQILFKEMKMMEDNSIYKEVKREIRFLATFTKRNSAFGKLIDVLYLQSKLAIIDLDYELAYTLLSQAELIAIEGDLKTQQDRIVRMSEEIKREISQIDTILEDSEELLDRLKIVELTSYLSDASRLRKDLYDDKLND